MGGGVQVLPIQWKHQLDFFKKPNYPDSGSFASLNDITLNSVPTIRGLVSDVILDGIHSQNPIHCDQ